MKKSCLFAMEIFAAAQWLNLFGMGHGVESIEKDGEGMTLTCIGFRPLPDEIAHQISHKFHLY